MSEEAYLQKELRKLERKVDSLSNGLESNSKLVTYQLNELKEGFEKLERTLTAGYVTKAEFEAKLDPVKRIAYGGAGAILLGFIGGLTTLLFVV